MHETPNVVRRFLRKCRGTSEDGGGFGETATLAGWARGDRLALGLFLAARELMFNVVKHAGVASARAELSRGDGMFVLEVSDDGRGIGQGARSSNDSGFGLQNLRERVKLLGGQMMIDSPSGCGTRARVYLPCPN